MNKIDFALVFSVKNANPNGDPLNGNRPRENYEGYGEVSDVCLKRKMRNRFIDLGYPVFVQSADKKVDDCTSLQDRAKKNIKTQDREEYAKLACKKWLDVRTFGQVFAFSEGKKGEGVSVGVRGPVTIQTAVSVAPIMISSMQITRSVNGKSTTDGKKASDTIGTKHRVDHGVYVTYGSINVQLAEKTGFTENDAQVVKEALKTLFENDCSAARPDGSMEICKVIWWQHNCSLGQYASAKVHKCLKVESIVDDPKGIEDYKIEIKSLKGLKYEEYDGI